MYLKSVLSNGLRVVTHDLQDRESVAIGLWVNTGGRYEDDRNKGAAHFLEHILFKGSRKYSCVAIKEQIEGVGGSMNAFTAEEQTCYYAKTPSRHVNKTFDILSDMVFFPLIKKSDVDKEKGVILEEIKMYHDLPQYYVLELLDLLMWPEHPLGKSLAGTPDSVSGISSRDLRIFHKQHYHPSRIVVSACGRLKHEHIVKLIKKKTRFIAGNDASKSFVPANHDQQRPQVNFYKKETEQMHLALGMLGLEDNHPDKYVLNLLHVILGGNMSSRLFNEVREKRGLAYSISSSTKCLQDTGLFMIRAGVDNAKLVEAIEVILKELKKIKRKGVTEDEFSRAKDYYLGQILMGLEDTLDHMLWLGESLINRNQWRTLKQVIKMVHQVTPQDIQRLARQVFSEKRYNLAIVGPVKDAQEQKLKQLMCSG